MKLLHLKRRFYEAHFVLASFARQASKYMKRHCVPWSKALTGFIDHFFAKKWSSIFASNNISLSTNFRKWEPKVNGSNVFTHCLRDAKVRGSNVITSRNYSPFHAFIDIVRSSLSWMVEKFRSKICKLLIYLRHFTEKWFFALSTILLGGIERQYQSRNWYKNKAKNACIRKNINNNTLYRNFFIIFHKDDLEIKLKSWE